jgi:hypothetical protein
MSVTDGIVTEARPTVENTNRKCWQGSAMSNDELTSRSMDVRGLQNVVA